MGYFYLVTRGGHLAAILNCCVSVIRAECSSFVAQSEDRSATEENNTLKFPAHCPREWDWGLALRSAQLVVGVARGIFILGLGVFIRVSHNKPKPVSHDVSIGRRSKDHTGLAWFMMVRWSDTVTVPAS